MSLNLETIFSHYFNTIVPILPDKITKARPRNYYPHMPRGLLHKGGRHWERWCLQEKGLTLAMGETRNEVTFHTSVTLADTARLDSSNPSSTSLRALRLLLIYHCTPAVPKARPSSPSAIKAALQVHLQKLPILIASNTKVFSNQQASCVPHLRRKKQTLTLFVLLRRTALLIIPRELGKSFHADIFFKAGIIGARRSDMQEM